MKATIKAEALKLGLIERLIKLENVTSLQKVEKSILQAEMEARTLESLDATKKGEVISVDEWREENEKWVRQRSTVEN